jgi:hypothetical protein
VSMIFTGTSGIMPLLIDANFPLILRESGYFLFILSWSSEISFILTTRVVGLLFPSG